MMVRLNAQPTSPFIRCRQRRRIPYISTLSELGNLPLSAPHVFDHSKCRIGSVEFSLRGDMIPTLPANGVYCAAPVAIVVGNG